MEDEGIGVLRNTITQKSTQTHTIVQPFRGSPCAIPIESVLPVAILR